MALPLLSLPLPFLCAASLPFALTQLDTKNGRNMCVALYYLVGLNLSRALLAVLSRVPCPLDPRRPLPPQPRPVVSVFGGLHRSCSSRPPVKTCLVGSLLWRWYPGVQHAVSILFSQPIYLSSVLVHDAGPLIIEDHRVTCLTDLFHRAQRLCHRGSFHDHASDCSFPHVQWQPQVSQIRNWLSGGRLKVFTAPGFN